MELLQLKYFYAVAKNLHVTNTAQELHVAQPALTQSIKRLESELGVKLIKTRGRNIVLTEYGEFLKGEIAPFMDVLDEIPGKLEEMALKNRSTVIVNVLAASDAVIRAIMDFKKQHEDVRIRIVQNTEATTADISIYTVPEYKPKAKEAPYVFTEKIFLAVPDNEEFSGIDTVELASVKDCEFISLAGSKQLRAICDSFCASAGFTPNIVFESDSPQTVRDMIEMQFGIGFWPQYSWGDTEGKKIRLLPITNPLCKRDIVISTDLKAHRGNDSLVLSLKEYIVKYLEDATEGPEK